MTDSISPWLSLRTNRMVTTPDTSFAAMTEANGVSAFVGGSEAMRAMRDAILAARSWVYIADWIFFADLQMVRDGSQGSMSVFEVLREVAGRGVKVYVSLYESVDALASLDNGDERAEKRLRLIPGVRVQRHRPSLIWSHHQKMVVVDGGTAFLGGVDLALGRWDLPEHPEEDLGAFPDPDWYNPCISDEEKKKADPRYVAYLKAWTIWWQRGRAAVPPKMRPPEPVLDTTMWRAVYPRMPWQDVHLRLDGPSAHDLARCFEEKWNFADREETDSHCQIPASQIPASWPLPPSNSGLACLGARVQVLRSVAEKTYGVAKESSILDAYIRLIRGAQRHVYIENQFFISNPTPGSNQHVANLLALPLVNRIIEAIESGTEFRVDLVLPVHSEGDIRNFTPTSAPHRTMFHQNRSLCRDQWSLQGQVEQAIADARLKRNQVPLDAAGLELESLKYLRIYCLRRHAAMPGNGAKLGRFATEQIYVHSKLMIVDDRILLIGSANINDRSLLGDRDSEIAVVVEDPTPVADSWLADEKVPKGGLAYGLRKRLWKLHWGADIDDPLADFNNLQLHQIAADNTAIWESVFPLLPSNRWTDIEVWNRALASNDGWHGFGPPSSDATVAQKLNQLRGAITLYPRQFLRDKGMETGAALADIYS